MTTFEQPEHEERQEEPQAPEEPETAPEQPETPEEAPEQPEEPAEPEPEPSSEALMEEIGKKLDALTKTVATRIGSILGEQANDFEVCDLCSYWNTPGWRHKGHLPEDLRDQMAYLIGQRPHTELEPDPHSKVCPICKGEGFVATGSRAAGQGQLPCVECESMGWQPTDEARRKGRLQLANGPTATALGVTAADAAMQPDVSELPPEVEALRAQGFTVFPPIKIPG